MTGEIMQLPFKMVYQNETYYIYSLYEILTSDDKEIMNLLLNKMLSTFNRINETIEAYLKLSSHYNTTDNKQIFIDRKHFYLELITTALYINKNLSNSIYNKSMSLFYEKKKDFEMLEKIKLPVVNEIFLTYKNLSDKYWKLTEITF